MSLGYWIYPSPLKRFLYRNLLDVNERNQKQVGDESPTAHSLVFPADQGFSHRMFWKIYRLLRNINVSRKLVDASPENAVLYAVYNSYGLSHNGYVIFV